VNDGPMPEALHLRRRRGRRYARGMATDAELRHPVIVDFPLRGEGWMAVTTPAHRIPSHGTDLLGQRYAYDFLKVDDRGGVHDDPTSSLRRAVLGRRTRDAYAWGASIHAPFEGEVVAAVDAMEERAWIHPIRELTLQYRNAATFTPDRLPSIMGNHVVLRSGGLYAGFAHLAPGSLAVEVGRHMTVGEVLGRVGHTGNSTAPHLHFQLMDSPDLLTARGIPCAFRRYEAARGGAWLPVVDGIPGRRERIRSVEV
jgi:hypothetical protein